MRDRVYDDVPSTAGVPVTGAQFQGRGRAARTRWLDAGAVLIAALMVSAWLIDPRPEPSYAGPAYYILSWGFGALSVFAVWRRRRCASALAFTLIVGSVFLAVLSGPSLVALFSVASYRPLKRTMWMTALALVSAPVQLLVGAPLDDDDFWRGTIPLLLVSLLAVGWGLALRARREVVESLRERAGQLARERHLVADWARRVEREEIARDMHDSLAHHLSLISMSAGALHYRRDGIPPELAELAATLQENSKAALAELRTAVRGIRSGDHSGASTMNDSHFDLSALVEDARASGQVIDSQIHLSSGLAPGTARIVYRTVQELLTNARKHGASQSVALTVTGNPEAGIRIMSTNEMDTTVVREPAKGFGLLGMKERIKVHGGILTVGRTPAAQFEADMRGCHGLRNDGAACPSCFGLAIVDDDPYVRSALAAVLSATDSLSLFGSYADGEEIVEERTDCRDSSQQYLH